MARGVGNDRFAPSVPVTRGELTVFMHRLYQQVLLERSIIRE